MLDDIKNVSVNSSELKTLATILSTGSSTSTDTQDKIVDDLKGVLVPTTSEVLWGVINGDILSTVWQKITANTDSLLSLGLRQVGTLVGEPYASIFRYIGGGATYVCYVNGSQVAFTTNVKYPVLVGGVAARKETTGSVKTMVQLMPMKIDQVGAASVMSNGKRFEMADDAQVYLWYKGQYYATKLTEVNSDDYYLTGWYDNFGCTAGKKVRVVSMPSWELFLKQDKAYRDSVLPPSCKKRVSIEAGSTFGWEKFIGDEGLAIGLDHFGASAPYKVLTEKFGFTVPAVIEKMKAHFNF